MRYQYEDKKLNAILAFSDNIAKDVAGFEAYDNIIKFLWNKNDEMVSFFVDGIPVELLPNQLTTITNLHQASFDTTALPIAAIVFNKAFYCVFDHDSEVSCNGILFYGTQDLPIITIHENQSQRFNLLFDIFIEEFGTPDSIQGDMLRMLLKRLIIMATRLAKEQLIVKSLDNQQIDVVRKFNFLVDKHYKTKRKVSDYAEMMFKSPKTLSNLFATYNQKTPQQIILERIALEAKRLINYTDKQNQEIAYELGFNDPAHFSKFFKKMYQLSPTEYREKLPFSV